MRAEAECGPLEARWAGWGLLTVTFSPYSSSLCGDIFKAIPVPYSSCCWPGGKDSGLLMACLFITE